MASAGQAAGVLGRLSATVDAGIERLGRWRWLVFAGLLALFGAGDLATSWDDARRNFSAVEKSDWEQTNVWLKSTECARATGAWLALCGPDGKLVPVSEEALGDDPGHALLLDLWAIAFDRTATLVDVARLNILLNTLGFVALAGFLFAIRAYACGLVFLYLGPVVYVKWIGVSPHWALLGVASLTAVLPMAILAREFRFLSPASGRVFLVVGGLGLALTCLVREAIGMMGIVASFAIILYVAGRRWRAGEPAVRGAVWLALLVVAASLAPYLATTSRDLAFDIDQGQLVRRHGFSDILYMGLGSVPNPFGISYDDNVAFAAAQRLSPDVVHCSPEFFRIMWRVYFDTVLSAPLEVVRIYLQKAWMLLSDPILEPGPPLGLLLLVGVAHFSAALAFGWWRRIGFPAGALIEGGALVFIGFFLAQGILASPARGYAMPVGAAILTLTGILVGFCLRAAWRVLRPAASPPA